MIKVNHTAVVCNVVTIAVFAMIFTWVFNPKVDLGGDNCTYYMYATSIARGEGCSDITTLGHPAANSFPPGYPLLMAPLRVLTDSVIAQKILNGLFLLSAALLFALFIRRNLPNPYLGLVAALMMVSNYRVLQFATIMMSEMSFVFFSALILWLLYKFDNRDKEGAWWRDPYLWLLVLCAGYAYQIRTQGVTIAVGVTVWMAATGRWRQSLAFAAGVALSTVPWTLRNAFHGLSSRYADQIFMVNMWRPEEGYISAGDFFARGVETLGMLISQALPNTVAPYMAVDYATPAGGGLWAAGIILAGIIAFGFWQYRRYFWFFLPYTAATFAIICLWSAPSENRYLVTLVPVLELGLATGLWKICSVALGAVKRGAVFNPLWILLPVALTAAGQLKYVAEESRAPIPPPYANYYRLARYVKAEIGPQAVVCCRKGSLFYIYSGGLTCPYKNTLDHAELIRGLIAQRADYVVLEQLGYASTPRYLLPALVNNSELFPIVKSFDNPETYLLKFDRAAAEAKFGRE